MSEVKLIFGKDGSIAIIPENAEASVDFHNFLTYVVNETVNGIVKKIEQRKKVKP